jgi:hypothetical protein
VPTSACYRLSGDWDTGAFYPLTGREHNANRCVEEDGTGRLLDRPPDVGSCIIFAMAKVLYDSHPWGSAGVSRNGRGNALERYLCRNRSRYFIEPTSLCAQRNGYRRTCGIGYMDRPTVVYL